MAIPENLDNLISQLVQELSNMEEVTGFGIDRLRLLMSRFPDNVILTASAGDLSDFNEHSFKIPRKNRNP